MRKSSEVKGERFPYDSKHVCYIEKTKDGEIKQVGTYVNERRSVYYRVKYEGSTLYGVWPGEWTSDLFFIDDIETYGKENRAEKYFYERK